MTWGLIQGLNKCIIRVLLAVLPTAGATLTTSWVACMQRPGGKFGLRSEGLGAVRCGEPGKEE